MMGRRDDKLRTGDEYDALTRAKRFYNWAAGKRKEIKTKFRRRERRVVQRVIKWEWEAQP